MKKNTYLLKPTAQDETQGNQYDVAVIGEVVIDKIAYVEKYPQRGTKIDITERTSDIGGTAAAVASALSTFGLKVIFIGSWSNDIYGNMIDLFFKIKKIKVIKNIISETSVNDVFIDKKFNSRTIYRAPSSGIKVSYQNLSEILNAQFIFLDRQENGLLNLIKDNKHRARLLIDTSVYINKHTLEMFKHANPPYSA